MALDNDVPTNSMKALQGISQLHLTCLHPHPHPYSHPHPDSHPNPSSVTTTQSFDPTFIKSNLPNPTQMNHSGLAALGNVAKIQLH